MQNLFHTLEQDPPELRWNVNLSFKNNAKMLLPTLFFTTKIIQIACGVLMSYFNSLFLISTITF